jgi:hypothetical protein
MPRPKRFPRRVCTQVTEEEYAALIQEAKDGGFDGIAALLRDILTERRREMGMCDWDARDQLVAGLTTTH